MIKLQDFAKQQGVTDRAIQKHLKTYATELEGLFQRKGPNGTWLTDEACEILRSKMKQQPVVVSETSEVVEQLRNENKQLLQALNDAKDIIIDLKDKNHALELENKETKLLEAQNADLSADNSKKDELLAEMAEELKGASEDLEETDRKLAEVEQAAAKKDEELAAARAEIDQLRTRKWYQLLFKKNKE